MRLFSEVIPILHNMKLLFVDVYLTLKLHNSQWKTIHYVYYAIYWWLPLCLVSTIKNIFRRWCRMISLVWGVFRECSVCPSRTYSTEPNNIISEWKRKKTNLNPECEKNPSQNVCWLNLISEGVSKNDIDCNRGC